MNNNIDEILQSAGIRATTNPVEIRRAVSQPDTVFATIEEDNSPASPASPPVSSSTASSATSNLSDSDFDEILQGVGFETDGPATTLLQEVEEATETQTEEPFPVQENQDSQPVLIDLQDSGMEVTVVEEREEEQAETGPSIDYVTLPENSKTALIDDSTSRFSGTEWYKAIQETCIIIAGIGGIGSNLAYQVARMHPKTLLLYDNDNVELANMSGQLFSRSAIGLAKVDAMANMIRNYTTADNIFAVRDWFRSDTEAADIMMCGFDSMDARKTFFTSWKSHVLSKPENERYKCLYLDGRLSIDTLQVFCITGEDSWYMQEYEEKYLFENWEADETVCSLKQTTYMACMIASFMTNLFTNFVANTLQPVLPYDLPFFTEYDAQNMLFSVKK